MAEKNPDNGLQRLQEKNDKRRNDSEENDTSPKKLKTSDNLKFKMGSIKSSGGLQMNLTKKKDVAPIKMSLSTTVKAKEQVPVQVKTKQVASVFNESDSEEEEMPAEAKMRMKNVGRETPTAAGPNSFGKGNLGFCDRTKMIERELKKQMDDLDESDKSGKG